jgi:hypothetical protein
MSRTTKKGSSGLALVVPAATVIISLFAIGAVASRGLRGARRKLEAPVAAALPEIQTKAIHQSVPTSSAVRAGLLGSARSIFTKRDRPTSKRRSVVSGLTFLVGVLTLSLLATGGSYALWNTAAAANEGTLNTGSIGLTINGATNYTLAFPTTKLAPGHSVLATATFKNTGSVPISVSVTSTTVNSTNGLASSLTITVTRISSACTAGLSGGTTAALASFNTTSAPYAMPSGASQLVCFELKLDSAAPASEEGGSTTFTMNILANQVRP